MLLSPVVTSAVFLFIPFVMVNGLMSGLSFSVVSAVGFSGCTMKLNLVEV